MSLLNQALTERKALVTGGSRGIGRAICLALASRGATVAINYARRSDAAEETASMITEAGGKAMIVGFDVSDSEAVSREVKRVVKELGGLDILVNNAGIAVNGLLMRFKDEQWNSVLDTNLFGAFAVTRAAAPAILKARERGRIINVGSVIGDIGNAGQAAYAASKAGLVGLTKALAREFAGRGVCVNAVAPGYIETDMTDEQMSEEQREKFFASIPLARMGKPEEIAHAVAFLAGPEAGYITGEVLRINGGLAM